MSLEQIKSELSEHYENRNNVLLFGDSDIDRRALIRKIHRKMNGEVLEAFEKDSKYDEIVKEYEIEYRTIMEGYKKEDKEYLRNHPALHDAVKSYMGFEEESEDKETKVKTNTEYRNWIKMRDKHENKINNIKEKILDELPKYIMSTNRTWKYVDCALLKRGLDVYLELVLKNNLDVVENRIEPVPFEGSCLFDHKGTLFIDNLHCDIENKEDRDSFNKLAEIIEKGKLEEKDDPLYSNKYGTLEPFLFPKNLDVSVNWLVVYVHNRNNFPDHFLDQFEQIRLKEKDAHVEDVAVDQVYEKERQKIAPFTQKDINWEKVMWEDIKMVIREKTREIDISVGDKKPLNYQYSQMGFKYQEKNEPTKAWLMFLCLAKADNNTLNYKTIKAASKYMKLQAFQDRIREIRSNIKCVFPKLTRDPIPHTAKIGYKPLFRISILVDSTSSNEEDLDGYNYQSETIVQKKDV